jgi:hypothetical protein
MFCVISVAWFAELWVFNAEGGLCKTSHNVKNSTVQNQLPVVEPGRCIQNYHKFPIISVSCSVF